MSVGVEILIKGLVDNVSQDHRLLKDCKMLCTTKKILAARTKDERDVKLPRESEGRYQQEVEEVQDLVSKKLSAEMKQAGPLPQLIYEKQGQLLGTLSCQPNANLNSQGKIQCILVVGSAYAEHILGLDGRLELGSKHKAKVTEHIGGSGVNYTMRLINIDFNVLPIFPIKKDANGEFIRDTILLDYRRAGIPKSILEFMGSNDFFSPTATTTDSYILIEKSEARRTIFLKDAPAYRDFKSFIKSRIDFIYKHLPELCIKAIIIGHIPEGSSESDIYKNSTEYLINEFHKKKTLIFANFGRSQFELGVDHWNKCLENVDLFQLNLGEVKKFFNKESKELSLPEIIKWFQQRRITAVITLESWGAIGTYKGGEKGLIYAKAFNLSKIVDTTGAGDAFGSGLISQLYDKPNFEFDEFCTAINEARYWAAYACTKLGGAKDCPNRDELIEFRNWIRAHQSKKGRPKIIKDPNEIADTLDMLDKGYSDNERNKSELK